MFQTFFGLVMLSFGLLLLIFNQRLANFSISLHKWVVGMPELVPGSTRAGFILLGLFCVVFGLLYSLHFLVI